MKPPKRVTVNVPAVLEKRLQERLVELKFRSASAYFLSLMVFDFYVRKPHLLTGSLHHELPAIQDKFFAEIEANFDNLQDKPPAWFQIRIDEMVSEALERKRRGEGL